ncbi:MAG: PEGA domain-containing protein [Spirochaetales bacterium]|nr:MAG: PEGA domain-containing protein [Spirochaetales bacterium]
MWHRTRRARLIGSFLILTVVRMAAAQEARETLTVGWAKLDAAEAPAEYRYAASALPRLLMAALAFVNERTPSTVETAAAAELSDVAAVTLSRDALAAAVRKRDLVALATEDPARRAYELASAEKAVATARKALDAALSAEGGVKAGPETVRPLKPWAEHASGLLLEVPADIAETCADRKLDLIFHGRLRSAGTFMAVDFSLYVASTGQTVWRGTEYAAPDDLESAVAAFVRPAATALFGRPYARLSISADPPDAAVQLAGFDSFQSGQVYFEPAELLANVSASGYQRRSIPISVVPGTDAVLDVSLELKPSEPVTITSDPAGATVYVDAYPVGTTPLELPGFSGSRVIRLVAPGMAEAQMAVRGANEGSALSFQLKESDGVPYRERFNAAKDDFYASLGWFVLSLPVSVLSYGAFRMYFDAESAAVASGISDAATIQSFETRYWTAQTLFWVSAAASAGLAVKAALSLVRYINASE